MLSKCVFTEIMSKNNNLSANILILQAIKPMLVPIYCKKFPKKDAKKSLKKSIIKGDRLGCDLLVEV